MRKVSHHADNRAVFSDAPRGYGANASDRDNRPRSGYAYDYRSNEQDASRSSYRAGDYRPRSNDERRGDEMQQASRNEPEGNPRRSEASHFDDRTDDRRQQPSRQPAKPQHGPSKIDRYVPDRPGQSRRAEPSPVNVRSASSQRQNPGRRSQKKSGIVQRREEGILKNIFRAWFAKQATRYNTSKGRADTANVSEWHIPREVVVQYLHDKSIGELPEFEEVRAHTNDQEYLQSLFKWRYKLID